MVHCKDSGLLYSLAIILDHKFDFLMQTLFNIIETDKKFSEMYYPSPSSFVEVLLNIICPYLDNERKISQTENNENMMKENELKEEMLVDYKLTFLLFLQSLSGPLIWFNSNNRCDWSRSHNLGNEKNTSACLLNKEIEWERKEEEELLFKSVSKLLQIMVTLVPFCQEEVNKIICTDQVLPAFTVESAAWKTVQTGFFLGNDRPDIYSTALTMHQIHNQCKIILQYLQHY